MLGGDIKMDKNQKLYVPLSIDGIDSQDAEPVIKELITQGWKMAGNVKLMVSGMDSQDSVLKMEVLVR